MILWLQLNRRCTMTFAIIAVPFAVLAAVAMLVLAYETAVEILDA